MKRIFFAVLQYLVLFFIYINEKRKIFVNILFNKNVTNFLLMLEILGTDIGTLLVKIPKFNQTNHNFHDPNFNFKGIKLVLLIFLPEIPTHFTYLITVLP